MVAAGVGVALVPEMAIDRESGCCYVRVSDPKAVRTIAAARLKSRSFNRVQEAFVEFPKTIARGGTEEMSCSDKNKGADLASAPLPPGGAD